MKMLNKKLLLSVILALFLCSTSAYAIVDNNSQTTETKKTHTWLKKSKKSKKQEEKTIDNEIVEGNSIFFEGNETAKNVVIDGGEVAFNNDVHSIFSLEDCLKIAVEYNPTLRSAVYAAQAQKTKIGQEWANYFPQISVGVDVSRNGTRYSYESTQSQQYNTMGYLPTVSGSMLLFDFGKTKALADSAKRTYESKESDKQETLNVLIYDIKTAYYNILFAQAQVKVYEDTVADYELQLKRAWSFYTIGKKPKLDVITAEYNLGKAKLNLIKAQNVLEVAQAVLTKIMGIPEYTNFELSSKLGTFVYDVNQDDALAKAFSVRPELISAKKKMEASNLNLRASKRAFTPDLGAFASYGNGVGNEYDLMNYQVGLSLKYSEFNILRSKKLIDEADATYKKAQADYDEVKHNLHLNVKKAYLNLKTSEDAIVIAKLALDEAQEQYNQVSGRYIAGVGDIIELKDGETTFLNARLDFYNALLNYNNDAANLEKEIGSPIVASDKNILDDLNIKKNDIKENPKSKSVSLKEEENIEAEIDENKDTQEGANETK